MTTTYREYNEEITKFAQKHNKKSECRIYTSGMENNRYHKEYCWADGANWYEVTELITEDVTVEVHGLTFTTTVEMWRTEYWSTEDSKSKYFYCK